MSWRTAGLVLVAACLALASTSPASAEAKGRIVGISPENGELKVTFSVAGLLPGEQVDLATAALSLAGRPLDVTATAASEAAGARITRSVMLVIDTSGSMNSNAGAGINGARAAAMAYLAQVPPDVQVGLVTFASDARLVIPLTTDRGPIRAAVAALQARGETALYDSITLAASSFPPTGDRQILLLSDGADSRSNTTLPAVTDLLANGDIALNAVAFRSAEAQNALEQLTAAAGGRVISTEQTAKLTQAFAEAAKDGDRQVVLTAAIPADFTSREGTVIATATAGGQRLSDSALAVGLTRPALKEVVPSGPRPADLGPAFLRSAMTLYLALTAMFLGLLFVVATAVSGRRGREVVSDQLAIYTLSSRHNTNQQASGGEGGTSIARSLVGVAEKAVKNRDLEIRLGQRLDAGGIPLKPAEWLLLHVGIAFLVPLVVLFLTNANLVFTVLALVLSLLGPWGYLKLKKRLRTRAFLAQLPDVLQLMSGSLSAGYSLPQAVDAVVRQGNEPVAAEFNKALVEARIGAPIEDALDDVGTRMESVDFGWVVMAIRIQRDVGGNLAEILSTVAATLRERERLRRQVQVLSAEGRLSAYILGGLPIAFGLYLMATRPSYLKPLVTDPIGFIMLGGMAILMVVGSLWMKKVVTVEV